MSTFIDLSSNDEIKGIIDAGIPIVQVIWPILVLLMKLILLNECDIAVSLYRKIKKSILMIIMMMITMMMMMMTVMIRTRLQLML